MTTIVNGTPNGEGSGSGLIVGIIVAVIILFLFFMYALPAIKANSGGTTIKVPDQINVNVSGGTKAQ